MNKLIIESDCVRGLLPLRLNQRLFVYMEEVSQTPTSLFWRITSAVKIQEIPQRFSISRQHCIRDPQMSQYSTVFVQLIEL